MTISADDLLLARAARWEASTPDKVFLTQPHSGGQTSDYTWRQTMDEVRRMASHLAGLDLPRRSQIAIVGKNSAHWIMADLAIWMAGHVSVPLYPTLSSDTARKILEHSESRLLFVGKLDDWPTIRAGVPAGMPLIELPLAPDTGAPRWRDLTARSAPLAQIPQRDPGELATIIYTSGTTGAPKGVMLSFGGMVAAMVADSALDVSPQDRYLSYLPLAHSYERYVGEGVCIFHGVHVYFAESLESFLQDLRRTRPTLFCSVPRLWMKFQAGVHANVPPAKLQRLLSIPVVRSLVRRKVLKGLGLDRARYAFSGAAPLAPEVIDWYRRLGLELLEGYGMSENHSYSHASEPGDARSGYVGRSRPGVETRISEQGEVLVKSPGMMMGYFKAPEMSAEVITADGFLRTGDRGELDAEGRLRITGRIKELFKTSKGRYIAPAPIENRLLSAGLLEQCCVTGASFAQPHAVGVLAENLRALLGSGRLQPAQLTPQLMSLRDAVNRGLESHEQLEFIAVAREAWAIENEFLTPTLKMRRARIEERYGPLAEGWYASGQNVIWE
ncbi:MAG: AMP-binding acetyl-CoA synthetase [Betaproteobacteria bacterium]|nr:MAG: AMP-binding acetyl-CoA synthetase [Betaproteobacteria bacterium]